MITVKEFINNVWDGNYTTLDIKNILKEITDGFKKEALLSIELSSLLLEEDKLEEYAKDNLDINYSEESKGLTLNQMRQKDENEFTKKRREIYFNAFPVQYTRMYNFRRMLYRYLESSSSSIETSSMISIHWLKGEESLRLFIEELISAGLIENRETEEIIQEHFYVNGNMPTKEPEPIKWLIESKYLAYLMHRLAEEFIINIKGKKHQLTASHFINSEGEQLKPKSLASQLSQIQNEKSNNTIQTIESTLSKLKS